MFNKLLVATIAMEIRFAFYANGTDVTMPECGLFCWNRCSLR